MGPHWPMMFMIAMPTPRLVSEPWLLRTQGRMLAMQGKTPPAARKTPKYRGPVEEVAARTM